MNDRKSIPTLRGFETTSSRLSAELTRLKIRPEPIISALDAGAMDALGTSLRMAAALQKFPDPLVLIDVRAGKAVLFSDASLERFPELRARHVEHPALSGWREAARDLEAGKAPQLPDHVHLGRFYERRAALSDGMLQIHLREKREGPQSSYPFPVIDYTAPIGFVSFRNEAARKAFPHLENHPILGGIREAVPAFRKGALRGMNDTVQCEGRTFRRSVHYIAQSETIRVFAFEITDSASQTKARLLSICARMEAAESAGWTRESLASLDKSCQDLLGTLKNEKTSLAKLEFEMMRFAGLLRRALSTDARPGDLDSFRSVAIDFFRNLRSG